MPVIGFLSSLRAIDALHVMAAFRQGIAEAGYVEGRNVTIDYRWAAGEVRSRSSLPYPPDTPPSTDGDRGARIPRHDRTRCLKSQKAFSSPNFGNARVFGGALQFGDPRTDRETTTTNRCGLAAMHAGEALLL
jgi:hypothetical protein